MGFLVKMVERHNSKVEENKRRKLPDDRILRYKITGKTQEPEDATRGAFFVDPGRRSPM